MLPSAVVDSDLKPEVDEKEIHSSIGQTIASFIKQVDGAKSSNETQNFINLMQETDEFMKPLIEGLELEGSYSLKDPCYADTLINPKNPKCLQGSPWT